MLYIIEPMWYNKKANLGMDISRLKKQRRVSIMDVGSDNIYKESVPS
jgi:hypothetical protein